MHGPCWVITWEHSINFIGCHIDVENSKDVNVIAIRRFFYITAVYSKTSTVLNCNCLSTLHRFPVLSLACIGCLFINIKRHLQTVRGNSNKIFKSSGCMLIFSWVVPIQGQVMSSCNGHEGRRTLKLSLTGTQLPVPAFILLYCCILFDLGVIWCDLAIAKCTVIIVFLESFSSPVWHFKCLLVKDGGDTIREPNAND